MAILVTTAPQQAEPCAPLLSHAHKHTLSRAHKLSHAHARARREGGGARTCKCRGFAGQCANPSGHRARTGALHARTVPSAFEHDR